MASLKRQLDDNLTVGLEDSFPASDPPASTVPAAETIIPPGAGAAPPPREEKVLTNREVEEPGRFSWSKIAAVAFGAAIIGGGVAAWATRNAVRDAVEKWVSNVRA